MTYPGAPAEKKSILPKIAVVCFVVGALVTGFFGWRIVQTMPQRPEPIVDGSVHVKEEGLTIYADVRALTPPCEVRDTSDGHVQIKPPSGSETLTMNGRTWYVVARSTQPVPAGLYRISCPLEESVMYSAGPKSSVSAFVLSILGAVFSFLIFIGLGITLLTVGAVKQRRRNRPANTFPGQPGAPGNNPYPPAPPQQNTFPAPPPYNPGPNPDRPQDR